MLMFYKDPAWEGGGTQTFGSPSSHAGVHALKTKCQGKYVVIREMNGVRSVKLCDFYSSSSTVKVLTSMFRLAGHLGKQEMHLNCDWNTLW